MQRYNLTNRFHIATCLFSNRSEMTSTWGDSRAYNNSDIPNLAEEEAPKCNSKLTLDRSYGSLYLFESEMSLGNDVWMVKSHWALWLIFWNLMVDSINCSYDCGELSSSQREAIITSIEKKRQPKQWQIQGGLDCPLLNGIFFNFILCTTCLMLKWQDPLSFLNWLASFLMESHCTEE